MENVIYVDTESKTRMVRLCIRSGVIVSISGNVIRLGRKEYQVELVLRIVRDIMIEGNIK
jgi:hypothetical protein